jgi:hypothetical protein
MPRLLRLAPLSCILLSGCASSPNPSADGKPDYVAMQWCSTELIEQYRNVPTGSGSEECGAEDALCQKAASTIAACNPILRREAVQGPSFVNGRFVFGLSTDAEGRVSELCLIDTNLGNTPDTLSCVARAARAEGLRLEPNQKAQPWPVSWSLQSPR